MKIKSKSSRLACLFVLLGFVLNNCFAKTQTTEIPLSELRAFSEAYYQIKSNYVSDVDDAVLIRAAIKGMVASLDQHSRYLPATEFNQFNTDNSGEYAGIGLSFKDHKYGLEIAEVIKNSPAARAGIEPGMLLTHIDHKSIQFTPTEEAFELLRGEIGAGVKLTIAAASFAKPKVIELVREIILLESVTSQSLPNNTGYIAISQFTLNSIDEFSDAISMLSSQEPLLQLILDLRNNPGGVMEVAVALSDLFINEGKLLISSGRAHDSNHTYRATKRTPLSALKVVVVMNAGSASASEILAAALHDHNKAIILGERSYGKGSIQTIFQLNQDSGMKITSAEYFSPLGHKIQDVGIAPDVEFSEVTLDKNVKKNPYNVSLLDDPQLLQAYNLILERE
jgi:carboxyl-terminal processing protease